MKPIIKKLAQLLSPKKSDTSSAGIGAPVSSFPNGVDMSDWDQVFSACLGKMYTVQNAFLALVKDEPDWHIDYEQGIFNLGKYEFHIQFLGTESYVSNSWLWGWENVNGFSDDLLEQARIAWVYGQTWGLEPFMFPQCELNETFNGRNFSLVVCGALAEDRCYYCCPTSSGQGAAFIALDDVPHGIFESIDGMTFLQYTTQCIQSFYLNHRIFVESFLRWNQTPFEWKGDTLTAFFETSIAVEFEKSGKNYRIKNLHQTVKP